MKTTVRPEDMLSELGPLRRYARSLARNGDDAEDLVQAALVRALERRASFRHSGSLRGWLLAILHNVFIDGRRARQAEAARETAQLHLIPEAIPSSQEGALRLAEVREAFLRLPEDQRAALHLVAIEGLSYQAAAEVLGVPQGTLMSRIARARATLRALDGVEEPARDRLTIVGGTDGRSA